VACASGEVYASASTIVEEHLLIAFASEANRRALVNIGNVVNGRVGGVEAVVTTRNRLLIEATTATGVPEGALTIFAGKANTCALLRVAEIVHPSVVGVVTHVDGEIDASTTTVVEKHLLVVVAGEANRCALFVVSHVVDKRIGGIEAVEERVGRARPTRFIDTAAAAAVSEGNLPLVTGESNSRALVPMSHDVGRWVVVFDAQGV
jgi:hypothetical protein